jgi:hypothetical protein
MTDSATLSAIRIFGSNNRCRDDYCISFVDLPDEVPPRSVRKVGLAFSPRQTGPFTETIKMFVGCECRELAIEVAGTGVRRESQ